MPLLLLPALLSLAAVLEDGGSPVTSTRADVTNGDWVLTWSEEFDGATLNASKWNVRTNKSHCCGPFGGGGELQLYLPDQVSVGGGLLSIRTQARSAVDPTGQLWNYTSGWIDTKPSAAAAASSGNAVSTETGEGDPQQVAVSGAHGSPHGFAQKYGRFEANCSLPTRQAAGVWPAFWLMPADPKQCWPTGGEVDVFEFNGNRLEDEIFTSYHWAEPGQCGKDKAPIPGKGFKPKGAASDWQTGFHLYAVEWFADHIDFFVDDVKVMTRTNASVQLPTAPMFVILDQAVDSWLFPPPKGKPGPYTGQGVEMRVDYVRVYQHRSLLEGEGEIPSRPLSPLSPLPPSPRLPQLCTPDKRGSCAHCDGFVRSTVECGFDSQWNCDVGYVSRKRVACTEQ